MHRRVTDIENLQKPRNQKEAPIRQVTVRTSTIAHERDIFVVVISVQEAMNIDKTYLYRGQYMREV